MPSRFYFSTDATEPTAAGVVAGTTQSVANPAPDLTLGVIGSMGPDTPLGPRQSPTINSIAQTALQRILAAVFVSPPLASGANISAQTWTIAYVGREANINANMFPDVKIYVRKANGQVRGYIFDADAAQSVELPSATPPPASVYTLAGAAVSGIKATDRIVCEVWIRGSQALATSYVLRPLNYNGTVDPIDTVADPTGDEATYIETPQSGLLTAPAPTPTKLYFHTSAGNTAGITSAERSAAKDPTQQASPLPVQDLTVVPPPTGQPAAVVGPVASAADNTNVQRTLMGKWVSPPMVAGTINAADWTFGVAPQASANDANQHMSPTVYVVDSTGATIRGVILDDDADYGGAITSGNRGRVFAIPGDSLAVLAGDRIVVEMWYRGTQTTALSRSLRFYYDGGGGEPVDGTVFTDPSSYMIVPQGGLFGAITSKSVAGTVTPAGALAISNQGGRSKSLAGTTTPAGSLLIAKSGKGVVFGGLLTPTGLVQIQKIGPTQQAVSAMTGYLPWLRHCSVELSNYARLYEYLARTPVKGMELHELPPGILYRTDGTPDVFASPSTDPAPWFDGGIPASAEFLGFVGIPKWEPRFGRNVTERGSGGGTLGPVRSSSGLLTISGWVVATTGRGLDYGMYWLEEQLAGCESCPVCDTEMMLATPPDDLSDEQAGRWRMIRSGLTSDGVTVDEIICPGVAAVSFTIAAEFGELFKDPQLVLPLTPLPISTSPGCLPFSQWFCQEAQEALDVAILQPARGVLGAIITIDCTESGLSGLEIEIRAGCDDIDLLASMTVKDLPIGSVLVINSAQHIITYIQPDGAVTDGTSRIVLPTGKPMPWTELSDCSGGKCVSIRRSRYCMSGDPVRIAVQTQERRR